MSQEFELKLEPRTITGKKVNRLRKEGILPATVYGKGVGPYVVQMNAREFTDLLKQAGRTSLIKLSIPGEKPQAAFVHVLQRHPVKQDILHVDFHVVDLLIEMTVEVPILLVGESDLVKKNQAALNQILNTIEIQTLPSNVPSHIDVDISVLDSFEKTIHIRDITPPDKVTITTPEDELVVNLAQVRAEEEPTTEEEAVEPQRVGEETKSDE
ncbi:MAG: Ribosomal protein L25 (general stress protein Ctc) [Chloroflexi bacterium AL-W]|nr:Ribosomal protein L25 (general stress protein Ctc) [Chloroflexi bacterium AL-N1]NOK64550.1 Ribosomal protein L25 (general stress protein Ctc) [Chloroflexi bacterium AL-N10]NOK75792.1 Ribosomal protein L25 (general stress protein Ctc) [Chloroflexi bacterium AL-N5]NOK80449.1 Ribosomal protein L25 (general stress protein Ctc) [Chloroflexi bacterium AL-W]NOK86963.1 Ribosomal protein L25 (general stress protein Ctc) [Chloroflexi bacterium AL-N15]